MNAKRPTLQEHDNLLLVASEARSDYYQFFHADDDSTMEIATIYESKLNDLNKIVASLLEDSPSKG